MELRFLVPALFWFLLTLLPQSLCPTLFLFSPRPSYAAKHSLVWGQRWLWLCPEADGAVGPQLSALSAVLSDGEGRGENEPHSLFPHCEWCMEQNGGWVRKTTSFFNLSSALLFDPCLQLPPNCNIFSFTSFILSVSKSATYCLMLLKLNCKFRYFFKIFF